MIRRILLLILISALAINAISCDDLEDNTPALQVMVNGELFKAEKMQVYAEEDGGYTLTGISGNSALSFHLTNASEGSYALGEDSENKITLINEMGEYTTAIQNGGGEILITDVGALDYLTGSFHFLATDTSGTRMHGANGHFYQVSFESDEIDLPTDLNNVAVFTVDGDNVNVTDIEAQLVEGEIKVVIIGEDDQRLNIRVKQTVEEGVLTFPDEDVLLAYVLNGDSDEVVSGVFEVLLHEKQSGQHLKAEFEGTTEEGHEIVGSFQVSY